MLVLDTPGVYIVQLDVDTRTKSSTRCYATAYDTIIVPEPITIFPNVVSPNGDGLNEILEFKVPGDNIALTLYNRYGVPVKTFERYNNDYSPKDLPAGTYYYLVKDVTTGKTNRNWFEVVR
jgi:gliding motility-associated-like protein